jgi:heme A synthase
VAAGGHRHLLGGFATLSLLFLLTLRLSGVLPALIVPKRLQYWATAGLLLVIGQIALGGWVSPTTRRWPVSTCPTCHGQWWPAADFSQRLSPDPAHRPQLPRRAAGQRCAHGDSPDPPHRRVAGDLVLLGWPGS